MENKFSLTEQDRVDEIARSMVSLFELMAENAAMRTLLTLVDTPNKLKTQRTLDLSRTEVKNSLFAAIRRMM